MRLLHLTLPVSDVGAVASYFHDVLQQRVIGPMCTSAGARSNCSPLKDVRSEACTWPSTYRTTASARQ